MSRSKWKKRRRPIQERADNRWIDLHLHSTASDGVYAPAKLMELAAVRGLAAVALTDHDTVAGLVEASEAATAHGIEFVPGIELDARYGLKSVHFLGYFIDRTSTALCEAILEAQQRRAERARAILERLGAIGVQVNPFELGASANGGPIGRPHIARALVRSGAARDHDDAFARYLGAGAPAHVPLESPPATQAIAAIRAAGGVACLAHPVWLGCASLLELETILRDLMDAGLDGLEVYHPAHAPDLAARFAGLAERLGLAVTGGSDFHAFGDRNVRGVGFGSACVSYECLAELQELKATRLLTAKSPAVA